MAHAKDLSGMRVGMLTVIEQAGRSKAGTVLWRCVCDCGNECRPWSASLVRGLTTSCGCNRNIRIGEKNTKHGLSRHSATSTWYKMHSRCENPENQDYKDYGGRGIKVCDRWSSLENFIADMGEKPKGMSIERKNNSLGYNPENCVWADDSTQARNRRNTRMVTFNGETKAMITWCEELGLVYSTVRSRLAKGLPPEEAFKL